MKDNVKVTYLPLRVNLTKRNILISNLGKELGLSSKIVSKLNSDSDYVSLKTLVKICRYLDIPIEEFVEVIRD